MNAHTVEKIGGTSMADFQAVSRNILIGDRTEEELYNRIFVVSAYGGITDKLLEHKKTREPGVFALFTGSESEWAWGDAITRVGQEMCRINARLFKDRADRKLADHFVKERTEGVRSCLIDLHRLCSFGHFKLEEHLLTVREMLSAIGEAHSAFNTTLLLQREGVNAVFIDLTGWRDETQPPLDERILTAFESVDLSSELPIVTGYAQCAEGLMKSFDRGYSEVTFSRIACLTGAREAVIHKEYHLSSADPRVVGEDRVRPIGRTNYDVADQLSNMGMEAIHPQAAKGLRQNGIPLRIMNTFQPHDPGTVIDSEYISETPCAELITGLRTIYAIEVFEQDMVGVHGYDDLILQQIARFKVKIVSKDTNANTITHYVSSPLKNVKRVSAVLKEQLPQAQIKVRKLAIASVIGSDLNRPGILAEAVAALAEEGIEIVAVHQPMRRVDIQFVMEEDNYEAAIRALHKRLIEGRPEQARAAA